MFRGEGAGDLWTSFLGHTWRLPPDNRIDLSFQKYILERTPMSQLSENLRHIRRWWMAKGELVTIIDFDATGYIYPQFIVVGFYSGHICGILETCLLSLLIFICFYMLLYVVIFKPPSGKSRSCPCRNGNLQVHSLNRSKILELVIFSFIH